MTLRRAVVPVTRALTRSLVRSRTRGWEAQTRLFVVGDRGGWSVDEDAATLAATARRLGVDVAPAGWARFVEQQVVFHTSQFEAVLPHWLNSRHRLGVAYLHGRPGTPTAPEFDRCFDALRRWPGRFERIQVTHEEMHEVVLSAGVDPARIFRIPIGIDLGRFPFGTDQARGQARAALGLPAEAFVVGSFQKDGVGWGEGLEPKLIKGPDVLVAVLAQLSRVVPNLVALLTGPARGYVRKELDLHSIRYRHVFARSHDELARAYRALDLYVVTSRQEGGPKAVLEAMATGVPLVTTRVGQAQELVEHDRNGMLADVDDVEAIAGWAARLAEDAALRGRLRAAGRQTAETFAVDRLDDRWEALFRGFVRFPQGATNGSPTRATSTKRTAAP